MAKMQFGQAPTVDFTNKFEKFALQNKFPPAVQDHLMMEEYARRNEMRKKTEEKNAYLQELRKKHKTKQLSCLSCSGQSYEECYANGQIRECSLGEEACFLETRFFGYSVIHVSLI